jgi:hypothetical protein
MRSEMKAVAAGGTSTLTRGTEEEERAAFTQAPARAATAVEAWARSAISLVRTEVRRRTRDLEARDISFAGRQVQRRKRRSGHAETVPKVRNGVARCIGGEGGHV